MKKSFLSLTLVAVCLTTFAQGKVQFANDSLHLVYFNPDPDYLRFGDAGLAGQGVTSAPTPEGETFLAGLYAGTSTSLMTLQKTLPFSSFAPGRLDTSNPFVNLTGISGGSPAYFQVRIWDQAYADPDIAMLADGYFGNSPIFQATPGSSIAYSSIVNPNPPVNSTWAVGTFNMDQYGVGSRGAIMIGLVPEPSTFALLGLGAATLLAVFNKRQRS